MAAVPLWKLVPIGDEQERQAALLFDVLFSLVAPTLIKPARKVARPYERFAICAAQNAAVIKKFRHAFEPRGVDEADGGRAVGEVTAFIDHSHRAAHDVLVREVSVFDKDFGCFGGVRSGPLIAPFVSLP